MSKILNVNNLVFSYNDSQKTLDNLTFSIDKGEYVCILGHNGSGKSTLAKLIAGLLKADSGEIYFDNRLLTEKSIDSMRQDFGIVFQNPDNQFVGVTVKEDIAFGLENRQYHRDTMLELIDKYSKLVRMNQFLDYNPENLSGGEKQRVAIAGVLAYNPKLIIFDESTSMLDPKGVKEVNDVIDSLRGKKTIISITHNLSETIHADRIIVLNQGKIVLNGAPSVVFKEKEILKASGLDILESMKLIELIEKSNMKNKKEIEEFLWEFTFQK